MAVDQVRYQALHTELDSLGVTIVAVSKTKPVADILELYALGHRDFGENYVQELVQKQALLPADVRWHFIGHLQTNKVKLIVPFVHMIHGVDSLRLLQAIDRQAVAAGRRVQCLLQVHIASEETKFGLSEQELMALLEATDNGEKLSHVQISGLMGMASFTEDMGQLQREFHQLRQLFLHLSGEKFNGDASFKVLSMGMSSDFRIAVKEGSNMVRIGSLIFGSR